MRAILIQESGLAGSLVLLADEMKEDPHCLLVSLGSDSNGTAIYSLWSEDQLAVEVFENIANRYADCRILEIVDEPITPPV